MEAPGSCSSDRSTSFVDAPSPKHLQSRGPWLYHKMCQFRLGLLAFLVVQCVMLFACTFLMEILFAVGLPSARADPNFVTRTVGFAVVLPIAVILLGFVFEEASRLFWDALDTDPGSLANFRLALTACLHYARHGSDMNDYILPQPNAVGFWSRVGATFTHRFHTNDPFDDDNKQAEDNARWKSVMDSDGSRYSDQARHKMMEEMDKRLRPDVDRSTVLVVDLVCPIAFEALTLGSFLMSLITNLSPELAVRDYVHSGFFAVVGYLAVWIVCHHCCVWNQKMREFVSCSRWLRRELNRQIENCEHFASVADTAATEAFELPLCLSVRQAAARCRIAPRQYQALSLDETDRISTAPRSAYNSIVPTGESAAESQTQAPRSNQAMDQARFRLEYRDLENSVGSEPSQRESASELGGLVPVPTCNWRLWMPSGFLLLGVAGGFAGFKLGWGLAIVSFVVLCCSVQYQLTKAFGSSFPVFVGILVVSSSAFITSTWLFGAIAEQGDVNVGSTMFGVAVSTSQNQVDWSANAPYPVCSLQLAPFDIIDLAVMASAVYRDGTEPQKLALHTAFDDTPLADWQYVARNSETHRQAWMEIFFPSANMTAVLVRGTATVADALEDLHFWSGISVLQLSDVFMPFLRQLPKDFVVRLLSMSFLRPFLPPPEYQELLAHVTALRERVGSDRMVITGHSLGGSMAAMLGAKVHARAVSFSGPGLMYTRGRFDLDENAIRDHVLTVKPRFDLVPQVDDLGGMVQEIGCRKQHPVTCHRLRTHLCELHASCGDQRGRQTFWAALCDEYMGVSV